MSDGPWHFFASPDAVGRFVDAAQWTARRVEVRLHDLSPWQPVLSTGVEVPFSPGTQRALQAAGERPRRTDARSPRSIWSGP